MAHPMILSVSWSISASVGTIHAAQHKSGRCDLALTGTPSAIFAIAAVRRCAVLALRDM
jgi:hypothetical protein